MSVSRHVHGFPFSQFCQVTPAFSPFDRAGPFERCVHRSLLMDITLAYFHPLFHADSVKRDFERIRAAGAGLASRSGTRPASGPRSRTEGAFKSGALRQSLRWSIVCAKLVHVSASTIARQGSAWALAWYLLLQS